MSDPPNPGAILLGIFLILCGLGITLLGGGCAIMWLGQLGSLSGDGGLGLFLLAVSLAGLVTGLSAIWLGVRMFRGDRRDGW